MGSLISRAKLLIGAIYHLNKALDVLSRRLKESPGIPIPNPTQPFWTIPKSNISAEGKTVPQHADIVIIGSGITGASFAYNVFEQETSLRIVMLEARDICSGATARNGGHINPPLYHDYSELKEQHGEEIAKKMIHFRLAHFRELMSIAKAEDIFELSQVRRTENFDVHTTAKTFDKAKEELAAWQADMPIEAASFQVDEGVDASSKFGLSSEVVGCIHGDGGAIHPYRFVTSLLSRLLDRNPHNFFISTHNPCTEIESPTSTCPFYTVHTPKGTITTYHVIHATNGWVSHLLSPLREKIIPARGTMSAQRPGTTLNTKSTLTGERSYVFYSGTLGYDYLTQLPSGENELMFGGGWASAMDAAFADIGTVDDSQYNWPVASHLAGALPFYFGAENWGREKDPEETEDDKKGGVKWGSGRTKASWSGILGISADGLPWVGRVPTKLSGRSEPSQSCTPRVPPKEVGETISGGPLLTSPPGEWISAGYTGEGMVHAWMSGKALAFMVLNDEEGVREWFPEILRVSEKRWKKADIVDYISRRL
ncbi:unnamed protein product [Somion occarium]|uniref:FAD dependent oxidoreductase domain-containing protein n=1 Tax=Somion occarium TaxID=3059160 RepID=A0ABP1CQL2_9APHY